MKRRIFLLTSTIILAENAVADVPKVQSLDDALRWLAKLDKSASAKTTGAWPLVSVLDHLAQSIEMSLDGYPQSKAAWFQNTLGSAAFATFKWRGQMSHALNEPILGAPALSTAADWLTSALRLNAAIERFTKHQGLLKPHFAYGALGKADFATAHVLHIANHQSEIWLG